MTSISVQIGASSLEATSVFHILEEIANQEIRPYFGKLTAADIQRKSDGSLVTKVDPAVEALLSDRLKHLLPDAIILGEETAALDPSRLDLLTTSEKPIWVIDPLDGTSNFAAGRPEFGMIVALVQHNKTLAGWIYDVPRQRTAFAGANKGAFLSGKPVSFPQTKPAAWRDLRGGWTLSAIDPAQRGSVKAAATRFRSSQSVRCAAFEYLSILENRKDFHLFNRLKPWDHCAGVLMLQEAGGRALRLIDGTVYAPNVFDGGLLVGANNENLRHLRRFFLNPSTIQQGRG